jgi:hypothetical protein
MKTSICRVLALVLVAVPGVVRGGDNLTVAISSSTINLGKLVRDNGGATTFSVSSAGVVSVTGGGARVGTGSVSSLSLTLDCTVGGSSSKCAISSTNRYTVTLTGNTASGGGSIATFSYGSLTGGSLSGTTPTPASPLSVTFSVTSWPVTLNLGFGYAVSATAARGAASAPYTVTFAQTT